jgi:hypothetical protein
MPKGLRSGANGCGRSLFWVSLIARSSSSFPKLLIIEQEGLKIPGRGWAEMIRKVYEVDPLLYPQCGGQMKIIAFLRSPHKSF